MSPAATLSSVPVVGVVADRQSYRNLAYLFSALPLWIVYTFVFSFGLLFGTVLSVVGVGFAILAATLVATRPLAGGERWLANALLRTDLTPVDDVPEHGSGPVETLRAYVDAPSTWRAVGFVSLRFSSVLLAFVAIFALSAAISLVLAPLRYPYVAEFGELNGEPVTWAIDALPEALAALALGVALLVALLHWSNLIAYGLRRMAIALLGERDVEEGRDGDADGGVDALDSGTDGDAEPTA